MPDDHPYGDPEATYMDMETWTNLVNAFAERNGYASVERIYTTHTKRFNEEFEAGGWHHIGAEYGNAYHRAILVRHDGTRVGCRARTETGGHKWFVQLTWRKPTLRELAGYWDWRTQTMIPPVTLPSPTRG